MAMPQLSATTSDDVLLGNTITSSAIAASDADAPTKKEEADEKDTEASNAVKANKGMILRKSVEYIRWVSKLSVRRRVWGDCESRDERGVVICAGKANRSRRGEEAGRPRDDCEVSCCVLRRIGPLRVRGGVYATKPRGDIWHGGCPCEAKRPARDASSYDAKHRARPPDPPDTSDARWRGFMPYIPGMGWI